MEFIEAILPSVIAISIVLLLGISVIYIDRHRTLKKINEERRRLNLPITKRDWLLREKPKKK